MWGQKGVYRWLRIGRRNENCIWQGNFFSLSLLGMGGGIEEGKVKAGVAYFRNRIRKSLLLLRVFRRKLGWIWEGIESRGSLLKGIGSGEVDLFCKCLGQPAPMKVAVT